METILEAKAFLNENYKQGAVCPCCNQLVKEYKRTIYARIAVYLISLYKLNSVEPDRFFSVAEIGAIFGGGDFAKLSYWGLIEEQPKDPLDTSVRTSGFWRITPLGNRYVQGQEAVSKYIHLLNGGLRKYSGPKQYIESALGKKFNYEQLMKGYE